MPLYLGDIEIAAGGGTAITPQTIIDFLLGDDPVDWCGLSDGFGVTGQVFGLLIGHDFDAYTSLPTAQAIADDDDAKQAVLDSPDAQDAVEKSLIAIAAGLRLFVPPAVGSAFMSGFYVGIMDTTKGNIIPSDYYQVGLRYALIVSDKSIEAAAGKRWKATTDAGPAQAHTRFNGLGATQAMATAGSNYEAAYYCNGLAYPSDGASQWYLPAMDELELIYRNLKCSTESNYTTAPSVGDFPPSSQSPGVNPSSDPTGAAYTSSVPAQTSVAAFKTGGAQALGVNGTNTYYWSSTEYSATYAWGQGFSGAGAGCQTGVNKTGTGQLVRPCRRFVI